MTNFQKYLLFTIFFSLSFLLTGCFQAQNDECAYRTVPTTNNPNNLPLLSEPNAPF